MTPDERVQLAGDVREALILGCALGAPGVLVLVVIVVGFVFGRRRR